MSDFTMWYNVTDHCLSFSVFVERSLFNTSISPDVKFYLIVFGVIGAANTVFSGMRAFLFACGAIRAAVVVHHKLLLRTMQVSGSSPYPTVLMGT